MIPPIAAHLPGDPPACQEAEVLARFVQTLNARIDGIINDLPGQIEDAVTKAVAAHTLSPEQRQWVELAIQREAQSIRLRQAIIEKTLSGLIWSGVVAVGYIVPASQIVRGDLAMGTWGPQQWRCRRNEDGTRGWVMTSQICAGR